MNLQEAIDYINMHTWSQKRLGLERTRELLQRLGNPQKKLRFVHVAGSNGKGSTCAMLERILREAGYRTGLFPSPYIEDFRERIQISGELIGEDALCEITEIVAREADSMEDHPSQFELVTAIGMVYFARCNCDIVVLEVGLGGEFDATNAIDVPEVAVITNIGLEHTEYLGDTLEKIARTKAGIIKTGSDVVLYDGAPEVREVVEEVCREKGCPLHIARFNRVRLLETSLDGQTFAFIKERASEVSGTESSRLEESTLRLALAGEYQLHNAAVVLTVVETLRSRGFTVSEEAVRSGLAKTEWPARFEVLSREPLFILDGGHNPQCAEALAETLRAVLGGQKVVFLMGVLADKEFEKILDILTPYAAGFICVTPDSPRALPAEELARTLSVRGFAAIVCGSVSEGIRESLDRAAPHPVVAFGSLYLAGTIRKAFPVLCKKFQRRTAFARRRALTDAERAGKSLAVSEHLKKWVEQDLAERGDGGFVPDRIRTVFSYRATWDEVDLDAFHRWAQEQGMRIAYPVSLRGGEMLAAIPESEDAWAVGKYDIAEPDRDRSMILRPEEIDLILVPCVAFDRSGHRCGHGAGYYDRYLPLCRADAEQILVAFDAQELKSVAVEKTDVAMRNIVTESGFMQVI